MTDTTTDRIHGQDAFARRHVGTDPAAQETMLAALGLESLEELITKAVPETILLDGTADSVLPAGISEAEAVAELRTFAERIDVKTSLIGLGYYNTATPAVIQRNVLENPAWYTAYTPYQPEISQGRLEALLTFQTMVSDLVGLPVTNASMLDEATAAAECLMLARRATRTKDEGVFLVDTDALPTTKAVLAGRAQGLGIDLVEVDFAVDGVPEDVEYFGALIQYPGASGRVWDPSEVIAQITSTKAIAMVAADLLAMTQLTPPGEMGADVVLGTSQRFGIPLGFGGPHAGFVSVRKGLERQLPGRLVGISKDADGHPAFRLSLQTREQHIRREKATSNITTAQVLLAVMAAMFGVYHGPEGLDRIARRVASRTAAIAGWLREAGFELVHENVFDTLEVRVPGRAQAVLDAFAAQGMLVWRTDEDTVHLSLDETTTAELADRIVHVFAPFAPNAPELLAVPADGDDVDFGSLARTSSYLQHPVFNSFHSETAMMRYLRRLADKDFGLDRGMIPLGSCTMKLNAATEMVGITWPQFSSPHPFAPRGDVEGYLDLIQQLETWLANLTGYDTVSLQPNAGSQGEYAGLLAIKAYHDSRGDSQRDICLVPSSAHGTNAASAIMAGMRFVMVGSDAHGNVDVEDLKQKIKEHGEELAAIMITYPSTHGVYESEVRTVCELVHEAGGQVYIDGANLNALLEVARFGEFGGDVSHLNLHKTFCIPHGGGGPGVGPIGARAHLAPFLPGHPMMQKPEHPVLGHGEMVHGGPAVSQAPYGSPSILPIPWTYIRLMGSEGLKHATGSAVLAANYLAHRIGEKYEILYTGENGLVAHECIVDLRPFTSDTGITVDDVAKRLIDYGFHAPTMSFPVSGTLMVEPTESEDLAELDRFADAMLAIHAEAQKVASGEWPKDDNPLVGAPHTAQSVATGEWDHPYTREEAVYPGVALGDDDTGFHMDEQMRIQSKYWSPVRRVEQAWGDRNLVATWPQDSA
ncbi:MAG: aminomethyl-transferring glycine dehydrogenase [Brachybacterium sp.]|nr:aminomethyl-transferring glycine dehydrogenase [Brachybacterium sp.]